MAIEVTGLKVTGSIRTRTGPIRAPFVKVDGTNVLVLTEKHAAFRSGTVFVPNRELARVSPRHTTHMAFEEGLYDAFRSGSHVIRRNGMRPGSKRGELQNIREDVATARSFVRCLLASGLLTKKEEDAARLALRDLIVRYGLARNEHKIAGRDALHRSIDFKDRLGRKNPSAAGFVTGSGIKHLLERGGELGFISIAVDRRTVMVWQAIEAHMEIYEDFRRELRPAGVQRPGMLETLLTSPNPIAVFQRTEYMLGQFLTSFSQISAQPFRKNAYRVSQDLEEAIRLANAGGVVALRAQYLKLRRGITWVFAQHYLETEVIAPLSFLMDSLTREEHRKMRGSGKKQAVRIVYAMDPPRFKRIMNAFMEFEARLQKCSDEGLAHPIKGDVVTCVLAAVEAMKKTEQDWPKVKKHLKAASALM